jgi:hypothetical protein
VGGQSYNGSGQIQLLGAPTTIHQYGAGLAGIGEFDINGNALWCSAAASGSTIDPNIQMVSRGYGMSVTIDPGVNTSAGDLVINGPLNVGNQGFYKRGSGSLWLNGTAAAGNLAFLLQGGTVFCGTDTALGQYAVLTASSGTTLDLKTTSQTVASATLSGTVKLGLNKTNSPPNAQLTCQGGTLTFGGTLIVTNLGNIPLAAGDSFILFNATTFAGNFSSKTLPALSAGLVWDTSRLTNYGTITVAATPTVAVSPASTNLVYGNSPMLSALASGTAPLCFQWYDFHTNLIVGATNTSLTLSNLAVAASGNYRVIVTNAYGKATNFSTVTVSKAALTVTANNTNKVYGQNLSFAGTEFTSSGLVSGDSVTSVTLASAGAISSAPAGSYAITVTNAVGVGLANYLISYVSGTLTVSNTTVTPPVISGGTVALGSGGFTLSGTGGAGQVYVLLGASNLVPPMVWVPVQTNTADTNGVFMFTDTQATNYLNRFYRIVSQ